jgi:hypothetical protein
VLSPVLDPFRLPVNLFSSPPPASAAEQPDLMKTGIPSAVLATRKVLKIMKCYNMVARYIKNYTK